MSNRNLQNHAANDLSLYQNCPQNYCSNSAHFRECPSQSKCYCGNHNSYQTNSRDQFHAIKDPTDSESFREQPEDVFSNSLSNINDVPKYNRQPRYQKNTKRKHTDAAFVAAGFPAPLVPEEPAEKIEMDNLRISSANLFASGGQVRR